MAMGIMTVGMLFIAGVFPVAIRFTTIATERTTAAAAADEAFAKIRLYGININSINLSSTACVGFDDVTPFGVNIDQIEFTYPSTGTDISQKKYFWSALCRLTESRAVNPNPPVQVTVFISRRISPNLKYPDPNDTTKTVSWPMPVKVGVEQTGLAGDELRIKDSSKITFINDGCTIVDDKAGRLYRILERYAPPDDDAVILLGRDWEGSTPNAVWVVPPPENGGRYPCIAIYQTVIRF